MRAASRPRTVQERKHEWSGACQGVAGSLGKGGQAPGAGLRSSSLIDHRERKGIGTLTQPGNDDPDRCRSRWSEDDASVTYGEGGDKEDGHWQRAGHSLNHHGHNQSEW